MASKIFKARWNGVYRSDNDSYYGSGFYARTGGSQGFNSYIGFDYQSIIQAINSSKTNVKVFLHIYVTDAGTFDLGMHKETSDRKTSSLPWYNYSGRVFQPGVGWSTYDITSLPTYGSFEKALESGYTGIVLYGQKGSPYGVAYAVSNNKYHMYIEIQGTWNTKPTKAGIQFPVGGETFVGKETLVGTAASDIESGQSTLRYQWAIFDGAWNYLGLSLPNELMKSVDFSQYKETSVAKVALRAYDGELYGDWVYSNVFTITHNTPPGIPTNLKPIGGVNIDRTQDNLFSWSHNDSGAQSQFTFRWRLRGNTVWNEINRVSTNEYYIVPANTFPLGMIEWQVRTYDERNLVGLYSETQLVFATEATDAPTIISPLNGEIVSVPNPTIRWSAVNQDYFNIEIREGSETGTVIWTTFQNSSVKGITTGVDLSNNTDYVLRLRIRAIDEIWSDWAEISFHTSFTPPDQPIVTLFPDSETALIQVSIENPEPSDVDVPIVTHNEVYSRVYGSGEDFKLIASNIGANSYFIDYSPASGVIYEYMVRAWGENDSYMDSVTVSGIVTFRDSFLLKAANPNESIPLMYNPSRSEKRSVKRAMMEFNGREYPISEFEEKKSNSIDLSFDIRERETLDKLTTLIDSMETLLYRDGRGRRIYCTVSDLSIADKFPEGYSVSFSVDRVDYKEGIV